MANYQQPNNFIDPTVQAANASMPYVRQGAQIQQDFNRANEFNPYGSSSYSRNSRGQLVRTSSLSAPEAAKLQQEQRGDIGRLKLSNTLLGQLKGSWSTPFGYDQNSFGADRTKVEDALYSRNARLLDPQWKQEKAQFDQEMADKGYTLGSENYNRAYDDYYRSRTDAYGSARNDAVLAGGQEQNRMFSLAQQARMEPYNEYSALRGQGSSVNNPTFSQMGQLGIEAPNVFNGAITTRGQDVTGASSFNSDAAKIQAAQISANASLGAARIGAGSDNSIFDPNGGVPTPSGSSATTKPKGLFGLGGMTN